MLQLISTLAYYALVLLCPLMMLFMMKGMHGQGKKEGKAEHDHTQSEIENLKQQNAELTRSLDDLKQKNKF